MIIELTEQEVDEARALFLTPGWRSFRESVESDLEDCSLDACKDAADLWFQKGRLATLRSIIAYEHIVMTAGQGIEADEVSSLLQ